MQSPPPRSYVFPGNPMHSSYHTTEPMWCFSNYFLRQALLTKLHAGEKDEATLIKGKDKVTPGQ